MYTVSAQITRRFLDREKVLAILGRQKAAKMNRMGGYVRRVSRNSLRRRKKPSRPGQPPSVRSRDSLATLKNIRYGLADDNNSLLVGPVYVQRLDNRSAKTVPELMAIGGTAVVDQYTLDGEVWSYGSSRRAKQTRQVTVRYQERNFMGMALDKSIEQGVVADVWSAR